MADVVLLMKKDSFDGACVGRDERSAVSTERGIGLLLPSDRVVLLPSGRKPFMLSKDIAAV